MESPSEGGNSIEEAIDGAIATCGGDARAAMRALLVALEWYEAELDVQRQEIADLTAAVSPGYVRGRVQRGTKP